MGLKKPIEPLLRHYSATTPPLLRHYSAGLSRERPGDQHTATDEQAMKGGQPHPPPPTTQAKSGPNTRHTPCSGCCLPVASVRCTPPTVGLPRGLPLSWGLERNLRKREWRTAGDKFYGSSSWGRDYGWMRHGKCGGKCARRSIFI